MIKARVLTDHDRFQVVGPTGTQQIVENLWTVDDLGQRADLSIDEQTAAAFELAGFDIRAHEPRHSKPCRAYRFGDRLGISGDTEPFEALAEFFDSVDVLVHECAYPDGVDAAGHTTPTELGEVLVGREVDIST